MKEMANERRIYLRRAGRYDMCVFIYMCGCDAKANMTMGEEEDRNAWAVKDLGLSGSERIKTVVPIPKGHRE